MSDSQAGDTAELRVVGEASGRRLGVSGYAAFAVLGAIGVSTFHAACGRIGFEASAIGGPDGSIGSAAAARIGTGSGHTCVVLEDGAVRCWGQAFAGQTGAGNTMTIGDDEPANTQPDVVLGGAAVEVAVGGNFTCARLADDTVRCFGISWAGHTGVGLDSIGDDETPASAIVDVGSPVIGLAAGGSHMCALTPQREARCWGYNAQGQLGYGNTDNVGDNESPSSAGKVSLARGIVELAGGSLHTCARFDEGSVRCWGANDSGQLGVGDTVPIGDDEGPAMGSDVQTGGEAISICAGDAHSCVVIAGGQVMCWGNGSAGALGYGNVDNIGDTELPISAGTVTVGFATARIVCGSQFTCALGVLGQVKCWGTGMFGELGRASVAVIGDDELPSSIPNVDVGGPVQALSADRHVCALLDGGALRCWGPAGSGELGYGNTENIGDDETPASAGDVPYR